MEILSKNYQPLSIEDKWRKFWQENSSFKFEKTEQEPYSIILPPPNVTGSLHIGHAFQHTVMDILIRWKRMQGKNVLWQIGTDHAGIATQMVVEKKLKAEENLTKHDLGREKFVERIWQWKQESGNTIIKQMQQMGASADWNRTRFTMDDGFYHLVQQVFIDLYDAGLIYRSKKLVNWDPVLKTAISDLEVENIEEDGFMYHIRYPFVKGQGLDGQFMQIATTRPETILADGALAVNPSDDRYTKYLGKMVEVPMTDRVIPIIADDYVESDFGTGCVKITPAHDFNDYQVGTRHTMEVINLFTPEAIMNENAPKPYVGLDRFVARDKIIEDLKEAGLLIKIESHKLKRPRCGRTGEVVEPYMTDQWFVSMQTLAQRGLEVVESGEVKFIPDQYKNMYFSWMRDIQDWCISRQLWWGHRIPAWYDEAGNVFVGKSEEDVRQKYSISANQVLRQDEDVLDTWFSSGLWSFGSLGDEADTGFHPTDVLVTGFDIIFFWVARMIMLSLYQRDEIPFKSVYVTGLIRDEVGSKMSKSKGNVLDPLDMAYGISLEDLLEKRSSNMMQPQLAQSIKEKTAQAFPEGIAAHGVDALRFTLAAMATNGRDLNWDMQRLNGYKNFCNKIWNAARFVFSKLESYDKNGAKDLSTADKWILSRLQQVIAEVDKHLNTYRFDLAASLLYEFIWNDYCDWYLELAKINLFDDSLSASQKNAAISTLLEVLEQSLRLLHPFIPFLTEELWEAVTQILQEKPAECLALATFPQTNNALRDEKSEAKIKWLQDFILVIRNLRSENKVALGKKIKLEINKGTDFDLQMLDEHKRFIEKLAKVESLEVVEEANPASIIKQFEQLYIYLLTEGLIDKEKQLEEVKQEIAKLSEEISKLEAKLSLANFVEKAPAQVVEKERQSLESKSKSLALAKEKLASLS